jgi:hypothetical protein
LKEIFFDHVGEHTEEASAGPAEVLGEFRDPVLVQFERGVLEQLTPLPPVSGYLMGGEVEETFAEHGVTP